MSFNTKEKKYFKIDGVDTHELEFGTDKMYADGTSTKLAHRFNNVPAFRDNGYHLELKASNGDYLELDSITTLVNTGDYIEFSFYNVDNGSTQQILGTGAGTSKNYLSRLASNNRFFLQGEDGVKTFTTALAVDGVNEIRIEKISTGFRFTANGVSEETSNFTSLDIQFLFRLVNSYTDAILYNMSLNGEDFLLESVEGSTITGTEGTTASILTSRTGGGIANDDNNYLSLDSANSDYIKLDSDYLMEVGDVVKVDFDFLDPATFILGTYTENRFVLVNEVQVTIQPTTNAAVQLVFPVVNTLGERISLEIIRTATGYEVIKNGLSLGTQLNTDQVLINAVNSRTNSNIYIKDTIVYSFQLGSDTFFLKEGKGITIEGLSGSTATITTSHVDGLSYIENNVWSNDAWTVEDYIGRDIWQKKSFALEFDSSNREYIRINEMPDLSNLSDLHLEITFESTALAGKNEFLFTMGQTNVDSFSISRRIAGDYTFLSYREGTGVVNQYVFSLPDGKNTIRFQNLQLYINGVSTITATDHIFTNFGNGIPSFFASKFLEPSDSIAYSPIVFQGENFKMKEGLGNNILGDQGTEAEILTEANGGIVGSEENYLSFDVANTDYLAIPYISEFQPSVEDYNLSFDVDLARVPTGTLQMIFCVGNSNATASLLRAYIQINDLDINIFGTVYTVADFRLDYLNSGFITLRLQFTSTGFDVLVDDVVIESFVAAIPSMSFNDIFYVATYRLGATYFSPIDVKGFDLNGEVFIVKEGEGNTTEGSLGSIGTLNTAHVDGLSYIDTMWTNDFKTPEYRINYGMWKKNGYAINFDRDNQDYLSLDSDIVLSGDFELMFDLTSNLNNTSQALVAKGSDPKLFLWSNGRIYFQTDTDALYLSVDDVLPRTGSYVYEIKRVGNDTTFYVDGVLVDTISGYNGDITINRLMRRSGAYFDGKLRSFSLNGETLLLREGQGITTKSESRNITATLKTSHVDGSSYIDTMWEKESSKYIDYN